VTIGGWEILLRLVVASALGAAVGLDRELRDRAAGTRTHLLVSLGAALFTLVGAYGFAGAGRTDPSRVAAQIVTGIGFLGAGVILRQGFSVRGLTTAGSLWVAAAIGMAAGAGAYWAAVATAIITLIALGPLKKALAAAIPPNGAERIVVELGDADDASPVIELIKDPLSIEISDTDRGRVVSAEVEHGIDTELLRRISDNEHVKAVRVEKGTVRGD